MTAYAVYPEFCLMPATEYGPYRVPARDFHYAIRRGDRSLVFRTETVKLANEILDALNGARENAA